MSVIHNSIFDGLKHLSTSGHSLFRHCRHAHGVRQHNEPDHRCGQTDGWSRPRRPGHHDHPGVHIFRGYLRFGTPAPWRAVGTILVPAMIRSGYGRDYAAAVSLVGRHRIGLLIPPSNPMIIYSILGNVSVTAMFTAGFLPGFMVGFAMCFTAWLLARKHGYRGDEDTPPFNLMRFLNCCRKSFFSLLTPFRYPRFDLLRVVHSRRSRCPGNRLRALRRHRGQPRSASNAHLSCPARRRPAVRSRIAHRGNLDPVRQDSDFSSRPRSVWPRPSWDFHKTLMSSCCSSSAC